MHRPWPPHNGVFTWGDLRGDRVYVFTVRPIAAIGRATDRRDDRLVCKHRVMRRGACQKSAPSHTFWICPCTIKTHRWCQTVAHTGQSQPQWCFVERQTKFASSILQVIGATIHKSLFLLALLHNIPNFIIYRSVSMKLYNTFDAIFFGNIALEY